LVVAAAPGANVDELLALARERAPELAVMRLEAEAAAERIGPAGAFPDPMFRVELQEIDAGRVGATKYTVLQPLPWFGKRNARRAGAQADADAARLRIDESWLDIEMRLKTAYAQYWQAVRVEHLARDVLGLIERLEEIARARYAGGLAAQQDAIRARTERTMIESELVALEGERALATAAINAILRRPATAELAQPERLAVVPPPAALDFEGLAARVAARNPALAVEHARLASAEQGRELAYRNRFPDVSVGVSPIQRGSRIAEWELMLEVSIPLQQGVRRSQEREAERMRDAAAARHVAAFERLKGELGGVLAALESARRTASLIEGRLLPLAQVNFESALAGYESGKVDFAALLEAQRQIRSARLSIAKAQAEQRMRLAELERIVGDPL
jgi:outer membrane protein TolC